MGGPIVIIRSLISGRQENREGDDESKGQVGDIFEVSTLLALKAEEGVRNKKCRKLLHIRKKQENRFSAIATKRNAAQGTP